MVFCVIIGKVGRSRVPVEAKLGLSLMAANPVDAEPNHFGMALDNCIIEKADHSGVVSLQRGGQLWPAHFSQGIAERDFSQTV